MRSLKLLAAGLLFAAGASQAQVTGTVTATTDYDFRGISQTQEDPALQASVDWADDSGLYVGAWASNVDFGTEADYEVDLYAGFTGEFQEGFGWDVGFVYYYYLPDDDNFEYPEIYFGVNYQMVDAKVWYSNDYSGTDESTFYLEANANFELPEGFGLLVHAGHTTGDGIEASYGPELGDNYTDWAVGVTKSWANFDFELKYVDTDSDLPDVGDGRAIFSVSTTFPWGAEEE
jgi:uncharacterized protein (TIGR02001 family)